MPEWRERLREDLADRYHLERELGQGGMATVYLAQDRRHQRAVAIKVLRPEVAGLLGAERFTREIAIVAPLVHPHIVGLLDSGEAGGLLYFVMPFLPGESLRARLEREGELPVADTMRVVRGVLAALEHAHAQGIVHRDIKPENILMAGGEPLVADFGIARALSTVSGHERMTGTGMAVGTAAYMAPEQAAGDPRVDHRADLYALGIVWYELLAGAHPFSGLTPQQQVAAHLTRSIETIASVRPTVPRAIADIITRLLEKRPADRFQQASEVTRALDALARDGAATGAMHRDPEPRMRTHRLGEDVLGRLTGGYDPRMPGDTMRYLDNGRISDTLVCYVTRWGLDPEDGIGFLRQSSHRAVAPALFGFDAGRRYRVALSMEDHALLLGDLVTALAASTDARRVIVAGFSTGADVVLRMAALAPDVLRAPVDGVLFLGGNLATETAFLSSVLGRMVETTPAGALPFLNEILGKQSSMDQWLAVNEYLVRLVRRFRDDLGVLRDFAQSVADPFERGPLAPFVEWYRGAARHGRELRCVFEDEATYRGLLRTLLAGPRDQRMLGDDQQPESILVEPGAAHFDLEDPALVARHVDALLERIDERRAR